MLELTIAWTTVMEGEEEEGEASCELWLEAAQAMRQKVEAVVVYRIATAAEVVTAGWGGPLEVRAEAVGNNAVMLATDKASSREMLTRAARGLEVGWWRLGKPVRGGRQSWATAWMVSAGCVLSAASRLFEVEVAAAARW